MTTGTTLIWNPLPTADQAAAMAAQATTMQLDGKTDNVPVATWPDGTPGVAPEQVVRQWTTLADAQEWINFCTPFNPQSAVIDG